MSGEKMPVKDDIDRLVVSKVYADGVELCAIYSGTATNIRADIHVGWEQLAHVCAEILSDTRFVYGDQFLDVIVRKQMQTLKQLLGE